MPLCPLCRPNPLDTLRQANIIRLKLIQSNTNHNRSELQSPINQLPRLWQSLRGNIVGDNRFKANVRMDENRCAENSIRQRI
jgi:hypothetical protein